MQSQAAPHIQRDSRGEWGGLQRKGTRQPLKIVEVMIERARRAKIDLALFAGDINKAFDSAKHLELQHALTDHIPHPTIPHLISDRHNDVYFRFTLSDGSEVVFSIPQGAVQGCSLGPLAFTIYYRAYAQYLDQTRPMQQRKYMIGTLDLTRLHLLEEDGRKIECEKVGQRLPLNKVSVRLDRLIFVDDHLEMWATRSAGELRSIMAPIVPAQKKI